MSQRWWGGQKSAKKVSRIIWIAPYHTSVILVMLIKISDLWKIYHKNDCFMKNPPENTWKQILTGVCSLYWVVKTMCTPGTGLWKKRVFAQQQQIWAKLLHTFGLLTTFLSIFGGGVCVCLKASLRTAKPL